MNPSRREMLRVGLGGLAVVSLSGSVPAFVKEFAFDGSAGARERVAGSRVSDDNVLVVVQLSGGNDGLNTVVPVGNDVYLKARPTIGLSDRLHPLEAGLALNPAMTAFKELFDDGQLAVINGCGYPNPNRSHFRAMEIWHSANPRVSDTSGWLGHYVEHVRRGTEGLLRAINVGPELPQALAADEVVVPSIQSLDDLPGGGLARRATNAAICADEIRKVAAAHKPDVEYPGGLGRDLRLIAQLIAGNFGTRIFYCQVGGFDTHANQLGQHERLLGSVAASIGAFTKDMRAKGLGEKVAVMCFSEFGRRVQQNSSGGTDHGAAGPMFVVGGRVKGGVYGEHPSLTNLDDGDLRYTTDFRRVYATVLDRWLNADSRNVLGNTFEPIEFL